MKAGHGLLILSLLNIWVQIHSNHDSNNPDISGMDLLLPYSHHHGPQHRSHREVRECQHIKYGNITHSRRKAFNSVNVTLPLVNFQHQLKDIGHYYYDKRTVTLLFQTVNNPLKTFSVLEPSTPGTCHNGTSQRATVRDSAKQKNCVVATNAGFFDTHSGKCLGNIISDGRLVMDSGGIQNVHFGVTMDGYIYVGYLSELDLLTQQFTELVGGVLWILREGEVYIDQSIKIECSDTEETGTLERFATVRSARTAVGHDKDGRILMSQIDGKTGSLGVDLYEFASILKDLGFVNAINLDGGGSATTIINGTLVSHPSDQCHGNKFNCERAVSTILCIHEPVCEPVDCSGHGSCRLGVCECSEYWTGSACDKLQCPADCSEHGRCTQDGCECDNGWYGRNCSTSCPEGKYGYNCSKTCCCQNAAVCDPITGHCECQPGFMGDFCQRVCPYGYFGDQCASVCNCDTSCFCNHINGSCNATSTDSIGMLTDYKQAGTCLAKQMIKDQNLVPNQAEQYKLCLTSTVVLGIVAAVSVVINISFFCIYLSMRVQKPKDSAHSRRNTADKFFNFYRLSSNESGTETSDSHEMTTLFPAPSKKGKR